MTSNQLQQVTQILNRDLILVANAGAGKTELLVKHYFELLAHGFDPAAVIAFTFTEKAASELRDRILKEISKNDAFAGLPEELLQDLQKKILAASIGTIHQFCLQVIEADRRPDQKIKFKIIDESLERHLENFTIKNRLRTLFTEEDPDALFCLKTFNVKNLSKLLTQWLSYNEQRTSNAVGLPIMKPQEEKLLQSLERMGQRIQNEISKQKENKGWLSFQDIENLALNKILTPTPSLQKYLNRFAHVLVDEFQDTSPIQIKILEALRENLKQNRKSLRLFCVGDPKQSIYRFRQVDVKLIKRTEEKLIRGGGEKFYFADNYRSTPSVLKLINAFSEKAFPLAQPSQPIRADAIHSSAILIALTSQDNEDSYQLMEATQIIHEIKQLQQEGTPLDEIAILFRASASALPLAKQLKDHGISYTLRGGQNLFDRQEILDLKRLLFFLSKPDDAISLVGILRSPLFLISDATLFFLSMEKGKSDFTSYLLEKKWEKSTFPIMEEKKKLQWAIHHLNHWKIIAPNLLPSTLLRSILAKLDLETIYQAAYQDEGYPLAIEQWLDWMETLEEENAPWSLNDLVYLLKELKNSQPIKTPLGEMITTKNAIQLLTIHAAKGLQFDTVFLIGLNRRPPNQTSKMQSLGNNLALKILDEKGEEIKTERFTAIEKYHRQEEAEENKRLLYVAMTRAKNRLKIFYQPDRTTNLSLQSILLKNLEDKIENFIQGSPRLEQNLSSISTQAFSRAKSPPQTFIQKKSPTVAEYSVSELETFLQCPLKHLLAYQRQVPDTKWEEESSISPTEMGTILHECIQNLDFSTTITPSQLLEKPLNSLPQSPSPLWIEEMITHLTRYLKSESFQEISAAKQDFSELPFLLKLEAGDLRGQMDRLIQTEKGWILIDFKFAIKQHTKSALLKNYSFQLKTYALAAEKILQIPLQVVKIHLLNDNSSFHFHFTPDELKSHRLLLEKVMQKMKEPNGDMTKIQWREACPQCGFNRTLPLCTVPQGKPFSLGIYSM